MGSLRSRSLWHPERNPSRAARVKIFGGASGSSVPLSVCPVIGAGVCWVCGGLEAGAGVAALG